MISAEFRGPSRSALQRCLLANSQFPCISRESEGSVGKNPRGAIRTTAYSFLSRGNAGPSERNGGRGDEFPVQTALALVAHGFRDATDSCVKASVCHWIETALFAPKQL
jgi:hypothetical protein